MNSDRIYSLTVPLVRPLIRSTGCRTAGGFRCTARPLVYPDDLTSFPDWAVRRWGGLVARRSVPGRGHVVEVPPRLAQVRAAPQQRGSEPPDLRPLPQGARRQ